MSSRADETFSPPRTNKGGKRDSRFVRHAFPESTMTATHSSIDVRYTRRSVLLRTLALALAGASAGEPGFAATDGAAATVTVELFAPSGKSMGVAHIAKVVKSDADWRHQLSPEAFEVTRHAATERSFSGRYVNNHADGLYRCICCDTALYDSRTKFDSGTGWPSFWQPISALNLGQAVDRSLGMVRSAISCKRCDAHLGHVFDDGPKPTGLRYCMNSVALNFVARV
ncbi:MAG TPA: peptide-methionine (R)-S-oxide reductase MsrB [Steroidobacteraceae bacterium]